MNCLPFTSPQLPLCPLPPSAPHPPHPPSGHPAPHLGPQLLRAPGVGAGGGGRRVRTHSRRLPALSRQQVGEGRGGAVQAAGARMGPGPGPRVGAGLGQGWGPDRGQGWGAGWGPHTWAAHVGRTGALPYKNRYLQTCAFQRNSNQSTFSSWPSPATRISSFLTTRPDPTRPPALACCSFETLVGLRDAATLRACLGPDVHDSLAVGGSGGKGGGPEGETRHTK